MISSLQLQNIRSHQHSVFTFEQGVNIIVGPNASGKTNALEAIHMLHSGKSFKSSDNDMIRRGQSWARIDGLAGGEDRSVKLKEMTPRKEFIIEEVSYKRLPHRLQLPVVVFDPSHLSLLSGDPDGRRSYLDGFIEQVDASYSETLKKYRRALQQRNRLLKQERISPDHVFVWDVQLSEHAGLLTQMRVVYLVQLQKHAADYYASISASSDMLAMQLESKLPIDSYADALASELRRSFELDRLRGFTGSGPHRDDIRFQLQGHDARTSASRGESRSIVLALKLAEMNQLSARTEMKPILLLDDVFSELDGKRRRMLSKTLQEYQSFITTTDADLAQQHFSDSTVIPIN